MKNKKIDLDVLMTAVELGYRGFCLNCDAQIYGIAEDAKECKCEVCGENEVFSAELLLMYHFL